MDYRNLLYTIPPSQNDEASVKMTLTRHPEVEFVSFAGVDMWGYATADKIPVKTFIEDYRKLMEKGVQTDGSSVMLPKIAELNNAKVDIIPDRDVNWYVDYNLGNRREDGSPVGTLRIPSVLVHNETAQVGSRVILKDAIRVFKKEMRELLENNPAVLKELGIRSGEEIDDIILTSATELEFWVKTPDDVADREQLATSQSMKEQYWKRTVGPVRTALEKTLRFLDFYGFEVEMGHKEVGGVKAKLVGSGAAYDHIMEQLEIDWKYAEALQAADNEAQVKNVVKDVFRYNGLDVTFQAKPIEKVAGNGEHTHLGVAVRLIDGRMVNLFHSRDPKQFMTSIGFGAIMGLLKNYEVVNPFISATNDALNRLQPGFEAPVCIVTSLGHDAESPSRNRTVLAGLVREIGNPLSTRFELRAPNPRSNTYLVIAASYMAMLDGIKAVVEAGKTSEELEKAISKEYGEEAFYLEKDRVYRSEKNVFTEYTPQEREKLFGRAPKTVWDVLMALDTNPGKLAVLCEGGVFTDRTIESYREAMIDMWQTELSVRIIHENMLIVRDCVKVPFEGETELDRVNWDNVQKLRNYLAKDDLKESCLFTRIREALTAKDYPLASKLQEEMHEKVEELIFAYNEYKKNIL